VTGGPTLRPPEAADSGPISALLIASIRTLCVADHGNDPARLAPWLANKTPEHVAGWIASGETRMSLAERAGSVAGVGGWTVAAPGRGRIVLLYVAPDHAGAGVGAALLARMEAEMVGRRLRRGGAGGDGHRARLLPRPWLARRAALRRGAMPADDPHARGGVSRNGLTRHGAGASQARRRRGQRLSAKKARSSAALSDAPMPS
jgi:GNAT superfamily N-acetyltransferase